MLDLRELFAQPWEGSGALWLPWWLRWVRQPRSFGFRSEIREPAADSWTVLDTMSFADGSSWPRTMHCQALADGRLRLSAEDMPGGAEVIPRQAGFDFTPYLIRAPIVGPLRARLRCHDAVEIGDDGRMSDRIELRFWGVQVGVMTMELTRRDSA